MFPGSGTWQPMRQPMPPKLKDVYRLLKGKSADWNIIGNALGVSFDDRQGLSHDMTKTNKNKLETVLNIWIRESKQRSEVSWNHLRHIIENELHYNDIAEEISEMSHAETIDYYDDRRYKDKSIKARFCAFISSFSFTHVLLVLSLSYISYCILLDEKEISMEQLIRLEKDFSHFPPECKHDVIEHAISLTNSYKIIKSVDVLNYVATQYYISLVIVKRESVTRAEADKRTLATLNGGPDEIMKKKGHIDLIDVFKPVSDKRLDFVLVNGAPGIGKSTLALQIARTWPSLTNYSIAILVRFREPRYQNAFTFEDLYPERTPDNVKRCIERVQGEGVLWILDGFDELPSEKQNQSIYRQLFEKEFFGRSTIVVTSRPSSTMKLNKYLAEETSKHVEIVGFSTTQINKYAKEAFKNKPKQLFSNFTAFYSGNPDIFSLMYVPLNTAIITYVFKQNFDEHFRPYTFTQLYSSLVCALLRRYELKLNKTDHIPRRLMIKEDIDKLPTIIREHFNQLTKRAYNGILKDQYIFTSVSNDLDLMNKISSLDDSLGTEYSYNFLHTTLQEYMAAVYVSQRSELIETVKDKNVILRFIFGISSQMETVDNAALSNIYDYNSYWQLPLLYEYPKFNHLNPYQRSHVNKIVRHCFYMAGYLIAHYKLMVDSVSFLPIDEQRDITSLTNGLKSKFHSGSVAVGKGKINEIFVVCYMKQYSDLQFINAVKVLLESNAYEKGTLQLYCDVVFSIIFSQLIHGFDEIKVSLSFCHNSTIRVAESKIIPQLTANKLITDVSLIYRPESYEMVQKLFSDSFISKLTLTLQDFGKNLPVSVRNAIANNKNIKQLILKRCDLSIEFLQAVLSSNNVIDSLEIVSLSDLSDNTMNGEILDTLFSDSSISYLGIPITIFLRVDYNFSKLLFNKNLKTIKMFWYDFDPCSPNFPRSILDVIRSPKHKLLKQLHIIFHDAGGYSNIQYLEGLTKFVSSYEGPICTITIKSTQYDSYGNKKQIEDLVNRLAVAAITSFYSISLELDYYIYRYLSLEYQDYVIPVIPFDNILEKEEMYHMLGVHFTLIVSKEFSMEREKEKRMRKVLH